MYVYVIHVFRHFGRFISWKFQGAVVNILQRDVILMIGSVFVRYAIKEENMVIKRNWDSK